MNKELLHKITGFVAIGSLFGLFFVISWLFNRTGQKIEGPHLLYYQDTVKSLTINITGNKQEKTLKTIDPGDIDQLQIGLNVPDGTSIVFEKHDKITIPKHLYEAPLKTFVISDIEGDFSFLKNILLGNKVIDENYNWSYGSGHLVVVGDIFDRGDHVTECLWLLYKLEKEAQANGGDVHTILGNHELMALQGDHRYLDRKYKKIMRRLKMKYKELFSSTTELGRWLRSKNSIEVVGKTLFVHGGISPTLTDRNLTIDQINKTVRKNIAINSTPMNDTSAQVVMGKLGPLWYRGYIEEPIDEYNVQQIIDQYNVEEIVVGHTVVEEITKLYNSKVYAIDVKRTKNNYTALIIENNNHYGVTAKGEKTKL